MFFLFLFFFLPFLSALEIKPENTGASYFIYIRSTSTPIDIILGDQIQISFATGSFGFVSYDFERLIVHPDPEVFVRIPFDPFTAPQNHTLYRDIFGNVLISPAVSESCEFLPLSFGSPRMYRFYQSGRSLGIPAVEGSVYVFCDEKYISVVIAESEKNSKRPAFHVMLIPVHIPAPIASLILNYPRIFPEPLDKNCRFVMSIYVIPSMTFVDNATLYPNEFYSLSSALLDYKILYEIYQDSDQTKIASGVFLANIYSVSTSGPEIFVPPEKKPERKPAIAIPATIVRLEPGQVIPRFPDSNSAFAVAEIQNEPELPGEETWVVDVNGVTFEPNFGTNRHVLLIGYRKSYTVSFYSATYQTIPAVMESPPEGIVRRLSPAEKLCDGSVYYPIWTNVNYTRPNEDVAVFEDGHVETLSGHGTLIVDTCKQPPSVDEDHRVRDPEFYRAEISFAADWRAGLSEQEICSQKARIVIRVSEYRLSKVFINWQGNLYKVDESSQVTVTATLPLQDIDHVYLYTDGGMRFLGMAKVTINTVVDAKSPIQFSHPRALSITPYRSSSAPGRINIAANVTDHTGSMVDTNALSPGIYLSTATHRFPAHDIVCTTHELLIVPFAGSPFASIDARMSSKVAACPRDVDAEASFQLGVPVNRDLVLWDQTKGTARRLETNEARVITATGVYGLFNAETGEYANLIELADAPYTAASDFSFSLPSRKHKKDALDTSEPDFDLMFHYRSDVPVSIWLVECEPFLPSDRCPGELDMFSYGRPGELLLIDLPYVKRLTLEIQIGDACKFQKSALLLPPSYELPLKISRIECATDCDGFVTAVPYYVDPYSPDLAEVAVPKILEIEYEGRVDGVLASRKPELRFKEPLAAQYEVEFVLRKNGREVRLSKVCVADPAPFFKPVVDLPVFCPRQADAHVELLGLNFEGFVSRVDCESNEIKESKTTVQTIGQGFHGFGAGIHCFNYTAKSRASGRVCEGKSQVSVAEKIHYNVNSRMTQFPRKDSASVFIEPGGEFDLLTADMVSADKYREYIDDFDGKGTPWLTGLPNGGSVEIVIPYPESYAHITRDFCEEPMVLGVDKIVDAPPLSERRYDPYKDHKNPEPCVVNPAKQIIDVDNPKIDAWQTTFGQMMPTFEDIIESNVIEESADAVTVEYYHENGCLFVIEWKRNKKARMSDALQEIKDAEQPFPQLQGTLSSIKCKITKKLSCPRCEDAEVQVSTNALSPVFFVFDDAFTTTETVFRGLGRGFYVITAIEFGGSVDDSVFCVVSVEYDTLVAEITDVLAEPAAYSCDLSSVYVRIHTNIRVPLYAMINEEHPPISSCADPRFQASDRFQVRPLLVYFAYICDGADIRMWHNPFEYAEKELERLKPVETGGLHFINVWGTLRTQISPYWHLTEELITLIVTDDRDCPVFVEIPGGAEASRIVASLLEPVIPEREPFFVRSKMETGMSNDDCIINATQTVESAVQEITWCTENSQAVIGSSAPIIDLPVVISQSATMLDISFLIFASELVFGGRSLAFFANVNFNSAAVVNVSSDAAVFSNGLWQLGAIMNIEELSGSQQQSQQVTLQYYAIPDGLLVNVIRGLQQLQLVLAYIDTPYIKLAAGRPTVVELLNVNTEEMELRLPRESSLFVNFETNGQSAVGVLVIFIPGGNVSGTNGTWTSSNSTVRVACEYLLAYPSLIRCVRGGYGGPTICDRETCSEFGGGGTTNSQSQSRSRPYYTPVEFPKEITFLLVSILIVVVIAGTVLMFAFFGF